MDIIVYNILFGLTCLFIGYLCGSIPFGIIISKLLFHSDVRNFGSNNSGGTNVARVYGKKWGIITILLDMSKIIVPIWVLWAIFTFSPLISFLETNLLPADTHFWNITLYLFLTPLGAAFGHCWPLYAGFKGGKTVSVFSGFGVGTSWLCLATGLVAFFVPLKISKYVSLSSMCLAVVSVIMAWIMAILKYTAFANLPAWVANIGMWGFGLIGPYFVCGWEYASVITVIAALLIIRHKANIVRLIHGTENKIGSKKKVEQEPVVETAQN